MEAFWSIQSALAISNLIFGSSFSKWSSSALLVSFHCASGMFTDGGKGCVQARKDGASQLGAELRSFLNYLRTNSKPQTGRFMLYQPVVESLVKQGAWKPEMLEEYRRLLNS